MKGAPFGAEGAPFGAEGAPFGAEALLHLIQPKSQNGQFIQIFYSATFMPRKLGSDK